VWIVYAIIAAVMLLAGWVLWARRDRPDPGPT
jgi:uncharacterized membrane protein